VPDAAATRSPKDVYRDAVHRMEEALAEAARAQWAGQRPDLHVHRRALIDARRTVPNDRLDPVAQVIRDLLTTYAAVLDELAASDTYQRSGALSPGLQADLERLRSRAARHSLPVLDDRFRFSTGSSRAVAAARATPAARPARAPAPAAAPASGKARRRRRPRGSGDGPG
jgi:hypothetical protein